MTLEEFKSRVSGVLISKDKCLEFRFVFKTDVSGDMYVKDTCANKNSVAVFEIENDIIKLFPLDFGWVDVDSEKINTRSTFAELITHLTSKSISYKSP